MDNDTKVVLTFGLGGLVLILVLIFYCVNANSPESRGKREAIENFYYREAYQKEFQRLEKKKGIKSMLMQIVVRFQFEGWHCWPGAPQKHLYLSYPHRHVFHVEARKTVSHTNRDIEIIHFKREIQNYCEIRWGSKPAAVDHCSSLSCEDMSVHLCNRFELSSCQVMEDGENGAVVTTESLWSPEMEIKATTTGRFSSAKPNAEENDEEDGDWTPNKIPVKKPQADRRFVKQMFWGTEVEGPHRGVQTLFVPGDVDVKQVCLFITALRPKLDWQLRNIYFGADNCRRYDPSLVIFLNDRHDLLKSRFGQIWAETDKITSQSLYKMPHVLTVFYSGEEPTDHFATFGKTVKNSQIMWIENVHDNPIAFACCTDDELFEQDRPV